MKIDYTGLLQALSKLHPQKCTPQGLAHNIESGKIQFLSLLFLFYFYFIFFSLIILVTKEGRYYFS